MTWRSRLAVMLAFVVAGVTGGVASAAVTVDTTTSVTTVVMPVAEKSDKNDKGDKDDKDSACDGEDSLTGGGAAACVGEGAFNEPTSSNPAVEEGEEGGGQCSVIQRFSPTGAFQCMIYDIMGAMNDMFTAILTWSMTFWFDITDINPLRIVGDKQGPTSGPMQQTFGTMKWLAAVVVILGLVGVGISVAFRRTGEALSDAVVGIVKFVLATTMGWAFLFVLFNFSDALTDHIMWGGEQPGDMGEAISAAAGMLTLGSAIGPGAALSGVFIMILMSLIGIVVSLLMLVVSLFRAVSLIILTLAMPIAAAGQITKTTQSWLPKVLGWTLALTFFRPIAALCYRMAFNIAGDVGEGTKAPLLVGLGEQQLGDGSLAETGAERFFPVLVAVTAMVVALIALPAMMKFFTWTVGGLGGGGAGLALASAGLSAAMVSRGKGSAASGQADATESDMGSDSAGSSASGAAASTGGGDGAPDGGDGPGGGQTGDEGSDGGGDGGGGGEQEPGDTAMNNGKNMAQGAGKLAEAAATKNPQAAKEGAQDMGNGVSSAATDDGGAEGSADSSSPSGDGAGGDSGPDGAKSSGSSAMPHVFGEMAKAGVEAVDRMNQGNEYDPNKG